MPVLVPVAGARAEARVLENATQVDLTSDDFKEVDSILASFPVAGQRFPPAAAKFNEF
jgi:pyridoxine 4-dehydrogenase